MHRQEPILVGKRLIVRLARFKDAAEILRFYRENEQHLAAYEPVKPPDFYSESYWRERLERHYRQFQAGRSCRMFLFDIKDDQRVWGVANLFMIVRGALQSCQLNYSIAERKEGQGLMVEALLLVIDFAFKELNLHRLMASHAPDNQRSRRTLERLGFVKDGFAKDYLYINGRWENQVLASLTNPDWTPPAELIPALTESAELQANDLPAE